MNVAVIMARAGSEGFPGKHLVAVAGRPLIGYPVCAALEAEMVDLVLVTSDDPDILAEALRLGATPVDRPEALCEGDVPAWEVYRHAVETSAPRSEVEAVCCIQGNHAVWQPGVIDRCWKNFNLSGRSARSACTCRLVRERPEWMLRKAGWCLVPVEPARSEFTRQALPPLFSLDGAVHWLRARDLFDVDVAARPGAYGWLLPIAPVVQKPEHVQEIHEPAEVVLAEAKLAAMGRPGTPAGH